MRKRRKEWKYEKLNLVGMNDDEYLKLRKTLLKYSISRISGGIFIFIVVAFIFAFVRW